MEFKITEAEAREMAKFEEEVGCDISAGPDWGVHLDKIIELTLYPVDCGKFVELLSEQFGNVMSLEEIEEMAVSFQKQLEEKLAGKTTHQKSA